MPRSLRTRSPPLRPASETVIPPPPLPPRPSFIAIRTPPRSALPRLFLALDRQLLGGSRRTLGFRRLRLGGRLCGRPRSRSSSPSSLVPAGPSPHPPCPVLPLPPPPGTKSLLSPCVVRDHRYPRRSLH